MIDINLSSYQNQIKTDERDRVTRIFDPIRKKYYIAKPEEHVRQLLIQYLVQNSPYKSNLISVEKTFLINGKQKRYDIVIFDKNLKPEILIECKAPDVIITQESFDQAFRYNLVLAAPYLLVTNGHTLYCAVMNDSDTGYKMMERLPWQ